MMQALLLTVVSATLLTQDAKSLDLKERPVSKVIGLLKDMGKQLQKEGEQDEELYEKLTCWCETNEKEKTGAIAEANRRIDSLTADIERLTAKSADLDSSIAQLNSEIAKNEASLDKASALRAKELAEFNSDEKDMINSIRALEGAITTLAKHQSFLQVPSVNKEALQHAVSKAQLAPKQRQAMLSFLAQPAGYQSYASQSGAIFGILEQMKETFESNMSQAQKDEMQASSEFASLKAAKTEEINSATSMVDSQTQDLADAQEGNAAAKQNLQDTKEALEADTKFLAGLRETCRNADAEYEERTKTRSGEMAAVQETIGILNSDESHDLMGATLGFLQTQTDEKRSRAARQLRAAAGKTGNMALAKLASSVQIDAFAKVQAAINEMVTALKQEQADEVDHKDFCVKELAENEQEQAVAQDELSDLSASIDTLTANIDTLTKELASANAQIKESKTQSQRAGEVRETENADFQQTVADQRAVQQILAKALARLKQFYGGSLVQVSAEPGAEAPPAPEGFKSYKKNEKSGGVMGLIQGIIDEAKTMEMDALRAEQDSQTAYENFVKDSNKSISTLNKAVTDKTSRKAGAEAELIAAKDDHSRTLTDSENLNAAKQTLHKSCDYVMDNFTARQGARAAEMEALGEAKAILSGA